MPDLQISYEDVIICDQIRKEDNGKALLIGVYNQDIILNDIPGRVPLSIYVTGRVGKLKKDYQLEFRIRHNRKFIAGGEIVLEKNKVSNKFIIVLPSAPLEFEKKGKMTVEVRPLEGRWRTIKTMNVEKKKKD